MLSFFPFHSPRRWSMRSSIGSLLLKKHSGLFPRAHHVHERGSELLMIKKWVRSVGR
jgi:hypothetical protein